jgi:hypothetical protein
MSYWIFVINDTDKVFAERMRVKKWPIFIHTQNRKKLNVNDGVIFYKAGERGKKFVGSAKINANLEKNGIDFSLDLTDVAVWDKGIDVIPILNKLELTMNKVSWGSAFQGGVRAISEKDYAIIMSLALRKRQK